MPASILRRAFLCPIGLCQTFAPRSDETGAWGECTKCGKRSGFVDRASLQAFADREMAAAKKAGEP